ncbi:hypothetical protein KR009_007471 [Drosophila setifemur]|nr:hypothetical protein KR009_007471 [Drosophila setifemur]
MPEEDLKVDSTRAVVNHWLIFRVIGVHPPTKKTFWGRHYLIYSLLWTSFFHICMSISMVVNFLQSTSLETFCESICVAVPHTLYMLKLVNVWRKRSMLLDTHRVLQHLDSRLRSREERRIVAEGVERAEFIFRSIYRAIIVVIILGITYISKSSERALMYPSWIPWNWKDNFSIFVVTATVHTCGIIETSVLVLNMSTYPGTYLILLSAHLKALACRLSGLGHGDSLSQDQAQLCLVDYIREHKILLHLFKSLEQALSVTCFLQFFCTACAQCSITYFLLFARVGFMRYIHMMLLLVAYTTETLMLCSTAELVQKEADSLVAAVYDCNWLDQSVHFRRLLILMLLRCQKPVVLVAGIVVPIRMSTFLMVCKGAYTMLTLLNEMRESALE